MALYVPAVAGLRAVYVNGAPLYDFALDSTPPPLMPFSAEDGRFSILLQVGPGERGLGASSFFPSFVLFGDARSVSLASIFLNLALASLDGSILLIGLFALVLFLSWKKNREFLAFAVYGFIVGISNLARDAAVFLLPDVGRFPIERAHVAAICIEYIALAFLIYRLYRNSIKPFLAYAAAALPLAFTACAVLPLPVGALDLALSIYRLTFGIAILALSILLAARGNPIARWLIPASCFAPAALALERFGPESVWNAYVVAPAGAAAFGVFVMLALIRKVADSFESTQALTDYVASVSSAVRRFIPREFLEHLDKADLVDLKLGDHAKKEMTIFFSDLRAFTELSETLTVEENFAFINSYLSRVVPVIKENGGFVDKYVGDGIMALFPGPKGPDEAIRSAIEMQVRMLEYNGHRAKMGYKPMALGVGIHTGDLMLGVVGIADRMENTVISDAVNLCSRLQSITKAFNIGLAISEQAFKELEDPGSYKYRFIGKVKVRGKAAPVSVFEIFDGIAPELFERKMRANMFFEQGMLSYYQKDFSGAMYYFRRVLEVIPEDGAATFYLDHCMDRATL